MEFAYTEDQTSIRDLARGILDNELNMDRLKAIEARGEWFDSALWKTLADAGLLGLVVPEEQGGMGFGVLELCVLMEEIGRAVAPLPLLPTLVLGAMPIAAFGTAAQKDEWLPAVVAGDCLLTAALIDANSAEIRAPATQAHGDGDDWLLNGAKRVVPVAAAARRVLVPAATPGGVGVFLVDPQAAGVHLTGGRSSNGEPLYEMRLDGVRVGAGDLLGNAGANGAEIAEWTHQRALVALCATQIGVSEKALEIMAGYLRERVQFGVPIGSFQAVQHRSADGYIDLQAMRWVTWRAAWRLAQAQPAARETAAAKFWAAEGGTHIAHTAQHHHGGIGVDVDYPIHRYFLWAKSLELSLGGAMASLARLGRDMARSGPGAQA
jgi:alkylation response protein AidB-like acyl-CoA dehydrogenase